MAINIIKLGDETLLDLSGDSITPKTLVKGYTAHNSLGELIVGTLEGISIGISEDGYWVIDGNKTQHKAIGEDGKTPEFKIENGYLYASYDNGVSWGNPLGYVKGENGDDGITPTFKIENGELLVSYDNGTSWSSLGNVKGDDGEDGVTPTIEISEDGYWIINGVKTEYKAIGVDGNDGIDGNDYILTDTDKQDIADLIGKNGYLTQEALNNALANYYNKSEIDKKLADVATGGTVDLSNYYTKSETNSLVNDRISNDESNYLKGLYQKAQLDSLTGSISITPSTSIYEVEKQPEQGEEGKKQNITISWKFDGKPKTITFTINGTTKNYGSENTYVHQIPLYQFGSYTYQVTAQYKDSNGNVLKTLSPSKTISIYNSYYCGCAKLPTKVDENNSPIIDSEFITSLSADWSRGKALSEKTVDCGTNQDMYIWYAYPLRYGKATPFMDTYEGGFEEPYAIDVTNSKGYKEQYYVYRSTNKNLGRTIIKFV